jgi:membrane protein
MAKAFFLRLRGLYSTLKPKNVITLAASVSFFAFLSLFPFLILVATIASLFLDQSQIPADLGRLLQALPSGLNVTVTHIVTGILRRWKAASVISFLVLLYSSFGAFGQLQIALNQVMGLKRKSERWTLTLKMFGFFLAIVLFLVILVLGESLLFVLAARVGKIFFLGTFVVLEVAGFVFETFLFALSYRYLAPRKLRWKNVLIGAVVASTTWEIVKALFGLYISTLHGYTAVYGVIGSLFFLMLWLFYSVLIYLVGAHISVEMP